MKTNQNVTLVDGSNAVEVSTVEPTFCKEEWLDKLAMLLTKIESMEELAKDQKNKVDKRKLFELQQTYKMINTLIMNDQQVTDYDEPTKVTRLLRVYRYIENYILDLKGVDRIINGGMFTNMEIYILPADRVEACRKNRWGAILDPVAFNLPSFEEVRYDTIKPLDATHYYALARGNTIDEYILGARHIDYVQF